MLRNAASLLLPFAFLLLSSISVLAQDGTTGRIAGTVKDTKGAVIAGAEITVASRATGEERKVISDTAGDYAVVLLPPRIYRVSIKAGGFKQSLIDDVQVIITQTTVVNAELEVGDLKESVTISTAPPLIQKDGPQLGRVVDSGAASELPLATRNFTQILALSPGAAVALPDNSALGRNTQNISVNGARTTQNNYQLNGVDANRLGVNAAQTLAVPAPETIQEFKVQTSLYDATFGRSGGGNVQAVTKSGGKNFHGSVYEYFRNDALNANNPFLKAAGMERPVLTRNIFGGLLGGKIKADKLFFFGSYQGTRERNGGSRASLSQSVLVAQGLTDDRSQQTLLSTFGPRLPNGLPATSINPAALALLNVKLPNGNFLIPTPQADGRYSGSEISTYREDQVNTNIDYRLRERDWLAAKFFFSNAPQNRALGPNDGANVPSVALDQKQNNRLISIQEIHTFSSTVINEARLGYNFIRQDNFPQGTVRDSDLGIMRANAYAFPGLGMIRIGGAGAVTIGTGPGLGDIQNRESSTTFGDMLSITRGRHSLRAGTEIIYYIQNIYANNNRRGQINFQSFNDFLVGNVLSSIYGDGIGLRSMRATDYSFFVQDDWRFSRKLTLNLGLRYELDLPPYDTRGSIPNFDPSLYKPHSLIIGGVPQGPPIGGFVLPGNVIPQYDLPELPKVGKRALGSIDPNNFGPRIGFAYSPLDSGRLVVRGGYGIFYSRASTIYVSFNVPPTYTIGRKGAGTQLADPYFHLPSQDKFPTIVEGINLAGAVFDRGMRTPYFHQYNTSVQYGFAKELVLEIAYVGTRGLNLMRTVAINQAQLATSQLPITNAVTGQVFTTNTPGNAQLRAPFQGVDIAGFTQIQANAQSTYNSLQASLTKRLSKGLQFLASYTYAKSIDNSSGLDNFDTTSILGNQLDSRANRGVSDFDRTHRFVLSYLWDLPRLALARSTAGRVLLSNWQVAGIITAMSGLPIDVVDSNAGSFYLGANNALSRPNWAPGATRSTATSNIPAGYFFNPFAFARPTVLTGQLIPSSNGTAIAAATGTDFGNVGRNALRGPRQTNVDFSVIKRFPFGESKTIEFRAEFFNLFNHVNFANPISNLNAIPTTGFFPNGQIIPGNAGDFGRITSTSNNPRLIQFALKFNF
jgi:hypothetical protein